MLLPHFNQLFLALAGNPDEYLPSFVSISRANHLTYAVFIK
jgi:hypothetical protein